MGSEPERYQKIAASKKSCRSCIMLEELPYLDKFRELEIREIETNKDGVLIVDVPTDRVDEFVDLYTQVMKPGRWNEYVGPKTGFLFKMPNGEVRHLLLKNTDDQKEINRSLQEFISDWNPDADLWEWLAGIDIYSDWLKLA
ncbi:MAG: hypothetical protein Q7S31_00610 [bacterium]|nr:hypothetical protein [bacterium]